MNKIFINFLTTFRALAGIAIFILVFFELPFLALILLIIASLTDYFDGFLARKFSAESIEGKIFDPLADKVLITFCLLAILTKLENPYVAFLSSLIISREILISGLREYAVKINSSDVLSVSWLAKVKTSIQMFSISFYLLGIALSNAFIIFISHWFLLLAALITVKTGFEYYRNLKSATSKNNK